MPCGYFSATTPINISSLKLEAVYRKDVSQKSRLWLTSSTGISYESVFRGMLVYNVEL